MLQASGLPQSLRPRKKQTGRPSKAARSSFTKEPVEISFWTES
jgi:hypothetical protein